jgi:hypothetical protein
MPTIYTCGSLGKRTEFTYEGNTDNGVILKFASGNREISKKFLKAALNHFRGKKVKGGFSMTRYALTNCKLYGEQGTFF